MSEPDIQSHMDLLNQKIETLVTRTNHLKQAEQSDVLEMSLEGLSTALEELRVTEEELRMQHEELMMTRYALEEERLRYQSLFEFAPDGYIVTDTTGYIQEANRAAGGLLNIQQDHLVTKPLNVYFMGEDRRNFHLRLSQLAEHGDDRVEEWEVTLQPRKAEPIAAAITITSVRNHRGKAIGFRWLLRDITRRKQIEKEIRDWNAKLEERVRERTARLEHQTQLKEEALQRERIAREEAEALREIGTLLSSSLQLSEVLELVLHNVERVLPHDGADLLLIKEDTAYTASCRGYGNCGEAQQIRQLEFRISSTYPLNEMIVSGTPMILAYLDTSIPWIEALKPFSPIQSFMSIPVRVREQVIGFLSLTSKHADFFQPEHIPLLQAFAGLAAVAIHNAQLYEQTKALAVLEERQRLARDLHDAVTQTLFTSSIVAESLPRLVKVHPQETEKHLEYLIRLNRGALAEMRTLLLELRPAHLTDVNLPNQLHQLVNAIRGRKEIEIQLTIHDGVPIPQEVQIAFYRMAQEAFNNISKHSRATRADVTLITTPDKVELSIKDNGRGFDGQVSLKGMGLSTMGERAAEVNASLEIISAPGEGTLIHILWEGKHGAASAD